MDWKGKGRIGLDEENIGKDWKTIGGFEREGKRLVYHIFRYSLYIVDCFGFLDWNLESNLAFLELNLDIFWSVFVCEFSYVRFFTILKLKVTIKDIHHCTCVQKRKENRHCIVWHVPAIQRRKIVTVVFGLA